MRSVLRCAAIAVVVAALPACDSEQPLQVGSVEALVAVDTDVIAVANVDIWQVWEDSDGDGVPDRQKREFLPDGPLLYQCADAPGTTDAHYPWAIAVEVSVLRSGSVRPEIVTTTLDLAQRFSGITRFDTDPGTAVDDLPPDTVANRYPINGRRVSKAHADFVNLCGGQPFASNLGQLPNPAPITLGPGDTVVVQARKVVSTDNPILNGFFPNPVIEGSIIIGGVRVSTSGTSQSTRNEGDGISLSYTLN